MEASIIPIVYLIQLKIILVKTKIVIQKFVTRLIFAILSMALAIILAMTSILARVEKNGNVMATAAAEPRFLMALPAMMDSFARVAISATAVAVV